LGSVQLLGAIARAADAEQLRKVQEEIDAALGIGREASAPHAGDAPPQASPASGLTPIVHAMGITPSSEGADEGAGQHL
jgi:hypothetical protein